MNQNKKYIQYGCGMAAPSEFLNFDCSPTLRFERIPLVGRLYTKNKQRFPESVRYGDIVKGLPVLPGSYRGVYCSHVLEHLALDDFHVALANTYNYLEAGGVFRFVLPDLERLARTYLDNPSPMAASQFMEDSYLGKKRRERGLAGFMANWIGNSNHLWMWDEKSMREQLKAHGFKEIRRAQFGDAEDKVFNAAEILDRFEGCLAMQCRK